MAPVVHFIEGHSKTQFSSVVNFSEGLPSSSKFSKVAEVAADFK